MKEFTRCLYIQPGIKFFCSNKRQFIYLLKTPLHCAQRTLITHSYSISTLLSNTSYLSRVTDLVLLAYSSFSSSHSLCFAGNTNSSPLLFLSSKVLLRRPSNRLTGCAPDSMVARRAATDYTDTVQQERWHCASLSSSAKQTEYLSNFLIGITIINDSIRDVLFELRYQYLKHSSNSKEISFVK